MPLQAREECLRYLNQVHYGAPKVPPEALVTEAHKVAHHRLQMSRYIEMNVEVESDGSFTPKELLMEGKRYRVEPI